MTEALKPSEDWWKTLDLRLPMTDAEREARLRQEIEERCSTVEGCAQCLDEICFMAGQTLRHYNDTVAEAQAVGDEAAIMEAFRVFEPTRDALDHAIGVLIRRKARLEAEASQ